MSTVVIPVRSSDDLVNSSMMAVRARELKFKHSRLAVMNANSSCTLGVQGKYLGWVSLNAPVQIQVATIVKTSCYGMLASSHPSSRLAELL
jgi:hypothetical protein